MRQGPAKCGTASRKGCGNDDCWASGGYLIFKIDVQRSKNQGVLKKIGYKPYNLKPFQTEHCDYERDN